MKELIETIAQHPVASLFLGLFIIVVIEEVCSTIISLKNTK